jgi:hypothetical protein
MKNDESALHQIKALEKYLAQPVLRFYLLHSLTFTLFGGGLATLIDLKLEEEPLAWQRLLWNAFSYALIGLLSGFAGRLFSRYQLKSLQKQHTPE